MENVAFIAGCRADSCCVAIENFLHNAVSVLLAVVTVAAVLVFYQDNGREISHNIKIGIREIRVLRNFYCYSKEVTIVLSVPCFAL